MRAHSPAWTIVATILTILGVVFFAGGLALALLSGQGVAVNSGTAPAGDLAIARSVSAGDLSADARILVKDTIQPTVTDVAQVVAVSPTDETNSILVLVPAWDGQSVPGNVQVAKADLVLVHLAGWGTAAVILKPLVMVGVGVIMLALAMMALWARRRRGAKRRSAAPEATIPEMTPAAPAEHPRFSELWLPAAEQTAEDREEATSAPLVSAISAPAHPERSRSKHSEPSAMPELPEAVKHPTALQIPEPVKESEAGKVADMAEPAVAEAAVLAKPAAQTTKNLAVVWRDLAPSPEVDKGVSLTANGSRPAEVPEPAPVQPDKPMAPEPALETGTPATSPAATPSAPTPPSAADPDDPFRSWLPPRPTAQESPSWFIATDPAVLPTSWKLPEPSSTRERALSDPLPTATTAEVAHEASERAPWQAETVLEAPVRRGIAPACEHVGIPWPIKAGLRAAGMPAPIYSAAPAVLPEPAVTAPASVAPSGAPLRRRELPMASVLDQLSSTPRRGAHAVTASVAPSHRADPVAARYRELDELPSRRSLRARVA